MAAPACQQLADTRRAAGVQTESMQQSEMSHQTTSITDKYHGSGKLRGKARVLTLRCIFVSFAAHSSGRN